MKSTLIKAKSGKDETEKLFEETIDIPENISEAVDQFGEEEVFSCWYQQYIIRRQASLRRPEGSGGKLAEFQRAAYQRLLDTDMDPAMAQKILGYIPPSA